MSGYAGSAAPGEAGGALPAALGLERAHLVALVGAGGKTTLARALAAAWAGRGERVLVSATTRMALAEVEQAGWSLVWGEEGLEAGGGARPGRVLAAFARRDRASGKALGLAPTRLDALACGERFERVVVEADGAARRPLKAPARHEPVVPPSADAVIAVAGLWGLGRPLDEATVLRSATWAALSGTVPGEPVTAAALARVAAHPRGLFKGTPAGASRVLLLNGAEGPASREQAGAIARALAELLAAPAPLRVVAGRLLPEPALEVLVPG